ncbi:MAG: hypothetical protein IJ604_08095 [Prevotella sp.]|nr:hypothetical protein [Prevotella sp.]
MSDFAEELYKLRILTGAKFIAQLKLVAARGEFHPLEGETNIYTTGGERNKDYNNQLNAARKAVELGYRVFILPNPNRGRTPDFIFEKRGIYKLYDLKTIQGNASVSNRLKESIGQCNRVLLNMRRNYSTRLLATDIKTYFEMNSEAVEVLIFRGRKSISISRFYIDSPMFEKEFRKQYEK